MTTKFACVTVVTHSIKVGKMAVSVLCLFTILAVAPAFSQTRNSVRFTAIGDWGGIPTWPYTTPFELAVAVTMGKVAKVHDSQFTITLGDNFYESGITDVTDKRWKTTYEDIFTSASLHRPWYVCAGNHDHIGNISAQLAYTKFSDRWNYPDLYYTKRFSIPNSESTLLIVFIDTVILTGNTDDYTPDSILPGPEDPLKADAQWKWIEDTLSNSKDDYVIVGGHYPVWSIAEHGPNNLLVAKLKPLLEKYNVTAYFCGHDHNMQHFKEDNSSVEYFVIGAGDVVDPSTKHKDDVPPRSLRYHWADVLGLGAFAYVEATKDSLSVAYYEALNGKNIYTRVLTPRDK